MPDKVFARFDGYELREVSFDRDVLTLASWISEDDFHQHLRPAFFLGQIENDAGSMTPDPLPTCYALDDEQGTVFYIRLERAARVNIQFGPTHNVTDRSRVARALMKGMAVLEVSLARARTAEWIFDTRSPGLKLMAKSRLGFWESPYELVRKIPLLNVPRKQEGPSEAQETRSGKVV